MKLKINGFENEIDINNEQVNILEIKNAKCFSHILEIINDKVNGLECNEVFLLDDNEEELNISKEIYIVFDLFNIDYNSKKILNKIYEMISNNLKNNQDFEFDRIMLTLRNYMIQEINELPFEFCMKSELDITDVLKLYNVKVDTINYDNILEKVEFLIDIISNLKIASIIVIPNLKLYLTNEELVELYKYSLYNNTKLLLIERNNFVKLKYEKILSIDNEFNEYVL